ncbi:MAG TPA: hypothetical protein VIU46_07800 [Gallionellaceae bacterium]
MMHFNDVTGLLGMALALAVLASRIPGLSRMSRTRRGWLPAAIFMAVLLPLGGLPLAGYVRGATGDLSITALVLLGASLLHTRFGWMVLPGRDKLLLLVMVAAAGFYPLALGWGEYDPYRLGYGSYWLLAYLLGLALLAAWKGMPAITFTLAAAVLAWSVGWSESTNLWDYLLDPLVSIYAAFAAAAQGMRYLRTGRASKAGATNPRA